VVGPQARGFVGCVVVPCDGLAGFVPDLHERVDRGVETARERLDGDLLAAAPLEPEHVHVLGLSDATVDDRREVHRLGRLRRVVRLDLGRLGERRHGVEHLAGPVGQGGLADEVAARRGVECELISREIPAGDGERARGG